jgi:hypothetical protein
MSNKSSNENQRCDERACMKNSSKLFVNIEEGNDFGSESV